MKNHHKTNKKSQQGITLVELGIVIGIITLLVAALASSGAFGKLIGKARVSAIMTQVSTVETAIQISNSDTGCWPNTADFLITTNITNNSCAKSTLPKWDGPYVRGVNFNGVTLNFEATQSGAYAVINTVGVRSLEVYAPSSSSIIDDMAELLCGTETPSATISETEHCGVKTVGSEKVLMRYISSN